MITKLSLIKSICKTVGVARKSPNSTTVSKEELYKIHAFLTTKK